jgi:hypothetical protein
MSLKVAATAASAENSPVVDQEGRPNCCSSLCSKVKQALAWCCQSKTSARASQLQTPLLYSREVTIQCPSRCVLGTAAISSIGLTSSSVLLAPVVTEIANRCFNEEMESQPAFNACAAPYGIQVLTYTLLLSLSSGVLGYVLQKLCKNERSQVPEDASPSVPTRIKQAIVFAEDKYLYETILAVIGLYNALPVIVADPVSFRAFLNCGFAGIGLGSALVGVYAREQVVNFQEKTWIKEEPPLLTRRVLCAIGSISVTAATMVTLTSSLKLFPNDQVVNIIRDLSVMILCRPIGYMAAFFVDRKDTQNSLKSKVIFVVSAGLSLRSPMVLAAYGVYLLPGTMASQLVGMSILGFTQGINDFRYTPPEENVRIENFPSNTNRVCYVIKNYWQTAYLGQVLVESNGVNLVIIAGLTQYYIRKLLRKIQNQANCAQKISKQYLDLTNRAQFDLLAIFPYSIIQSNDNTYSDFYTYSPVVPLVILGITFGTYKENIDAKYSP